MTIVTATPPIATPSNPGLMPADDKTKVDNLGTISTSNLTISTSDPSGPGDEGDIWIKVV
jgi:hypothetical protein